MPDRLMYSVAVMRLMSLLEKRLKSLKLDSIRITIDGDVLTLFGNDETKLMVLSLTECLINESEENSDSQLMSPEPEDLRELLTRLKNELQVSDYDSTPFVDTDLRCSYTNHGKVIQPEINETKSEEGKVGSYVSQYLSDRISWLDLLREIDRVWKNTGIDRQCEVLVKDRVTKITVFETVDRLKYKIQIYSDGKNFLPGYQRVSIHCEMIGTKHHQFSHELNIKVETDSEDTLYNRTLQWVTEVSDRITRPATFAFESNEEAHWRFIQSSFNYLLFK